MGWQDRGTEVIAPFGLLGPELDFTITKLELTNSKTDVILLLYLGDTPGELSWRKVR